MTKINELKFKEQTGRRKRKRGKQVVTMEGKI